MNYSSPGSKPKPSKITVTAENVDAVCFISYNADILSRREVHMKKGTGILLLLLMLCFAVTAVSDGRALPQDIAAGDLITFGLYEQDNDLDNGPEPVEWIVLDAQDGKALLLSKYGLDDIPYNTEWINITWEECTLRTWLNSDFLNSAFTAEEQSAILTTEVDNSSAQGYSEWNTSGGNNTQDRVFLLSCAEANRYLSVTFDSYSTNSDNRVAPTAYAIARGSWGSDEYRTEDGLPAGWWWLRSPGQDQNYAARVDYDGSLLISAVNKKDGVVRPAVWISLESGTI